jgi:hypothetical protein
VIRRFVLLVMVQICCIHTYTNPSKFVL